MVSFGNDLIPNIVFRPYDPNVRIQVVELSRLRITGPRRANFNSPQRPNFDVIIAIESGSLCHTVDFEPYWLSSGDYLWVHANQIQQWGDLNDAEGVAVLFQSEVLTPLAVEYLHRSGIWFGTVYRQCDVSSQVAKLVEILRELGEAKSLNRNLSAERALEALLLQFPPVAYEQVEARGLSLYEQFISLLDVEGSVQRSVQHFATLMGCSPKKLNESVKERRGRTVKQAIDERLVLEAKRHLAYRPDLPIREVAEALGFDDTANFSKFFKRLVHCAPGSWRSSFIQTGQSELP